MNILALETATNVCSVAVSRNGRIVACSSLHRARAHAEQLVPMIEDVLEYADLDTKNLTTIAVSSGPGSYTGLRIGASTAKGLALAVDARIVSIPSLEARAHLVRPFAAPGDDIVAATMARKGEAYVALFRITDRTDLESICEPAMIPIEEIPKWTRETRGSGHLYLTGDPFLGEVNLFGRSNIPSEASLPHEANLPSNANTLNEANRGPATTPNRSEEKSVHVMEGDAFLPSAIPIAQMGAVKFERGETEDVADFEPHYLKAFVAKKPRMTTLEKLSI